MITIFIYIFFVGLPLLAILLIYLLWQRRKTKNALAKWQETEASGMTEPASLHPIIDPVKCLGCGTCVSACPEGEILALVKRKAKLVSPTHCIGHGACKEACPTGAITLVFGSETRGIEIPQLTETFETSVPGIYIAGELGGMGLIKNAIAQGQQAITAIAKRKSKPQEKFLDLVIVGAGPAGLSAALAAKEKKLKAVCLEQDTIGGTVAHYPRGKIVMTRPAVLPIVGKFQFREASKESLVEFWDSVVSKANLDIKTGQCVGSIAQVDGGFLVKTQKDEFHCKSVLLAMGRRGTPRKLNVNGEELSKVVYRFIDPEQYNEQHVVVVGGGDSALEAALTIADQPGTSVILSYRGENFSRAKPKNRDRVYAAVKEGKLNLLLESNVIGISQEGIAIDTKQGAKEYPNHSVIVCAGGELPTPFLKKIGIDVEEKFGTA